MPDDGNQAIDKKADRIQTWAKSQSMGVVMPKQKPETKLEKLRQQQKELAVQLRQAESAARKKDTELQRRKAELVGAVVLKAIDENGHDDLKTIVRKLLGAGLVKAGDRTLFGLPVLSREAKQKAEKTA